MELSEVRERKHALEEKLAGLLAGFEDETGTEVQKVAVGRLDVASFGESQSTALGSVHLIITV